MGASGGETTLVPLSLSAQVETPLMAQEEQSTLYLVYQIHDPRNDNFPHLAAHGQRCSEFDGARPPDVILQ